MWSFFRKARVGEYIKLTWLPNSRNHPTTRSCYIGMEGVVQESDEHGVYLCCRSCMLIVGRRYRYKILKDERKVI